MVKKISHSNPIVSIVMYSISVPILDTLQIIKFLAGERR